MSKRLDVLTAIIALCQAAAPQAEVVGLTDDDEAPARVATGGRIVVRSGDPGDPEVDLCPVVYYWTHRIPVEVLRRPTSSATGEELLDATLAAIGQGVVTDRQLGGLCDWLDVAAPATEGLYVEGGAQSRGAILTITAIYSTTSPTG